MRNGFSQNRLLLILCPVETAKITVFAAHQADRTRSDVFGEGCCHACF